MFGSSSNCSHLLMLATYMYLILFITHHSWEIHQHVENLAILKKVKMCGSVCDSLRSNTALLVHVHWHSEAETKLLYRPTYTKTWGDTQAGTECNKAHFEANIVLVTHCIYLITLVACYFADNMLHQTQSGTFSQQSYIKTLILIIRKMLNTGWYNQPGTGKYISH